MTSPSDLSHTNKLAEPRGGGVSLGNSTRLSVDAPPDVSPVLPQPISIRVSHDRESLFQLDTRVHQPRQLMGSGKITPVSPANFWSAATTSRRIGTPLALRSILQRARLSPGRSTDVDPPLGVSE